MTELSLNMIYTRTDAALIFLAFYGGLMLFLGAMLLTFKFWAPLFEKYMPNAFYDKEELQQPHKQQFKKTA